MILTSPFPFWTEWWNFMEIPSEERRAAFEKLPPERRSSIMGTHLGQVRREYRLTGPELRALSDLSKAAVPAAFNGDQAAREKFLKAEEHLFRTVSRPVADAVRKLRPPSKPKPSDSKRDF